MVNTDDFIKRIEILLDHYAISASVFADKVGVQRSGLSHLLSGRNKPSLDFIMKIMESFPEVDLYWLLNGTGTFPKEIETTVASPAASPVAETLPPPAPVAVSEKTEPIITDLFSQVEIAEPAPATAQEIEPVNKAAVKKPETAKKIEKVLLFYTDGTFKEYTPEN
ncbi:transcriptional regulator [Flavobacterium album]|uniref:Transcriptional regulator n=1 Tax=Flavobacterium album TaxID=2175091 RepID=A0A2S1R0K7_9FLAO|nr:helix-turn-helix transcriptional regulator [Flavobacterium album]AWH86089.1 transcriptional regulator [Flavobacterium album]